MGAATFEVFDYTSYDAGTRRETVSKGFLTVTAKPTIGGTLNIGAKPLALRLGCDPRKTSPAGTNELDVAFAGGLVDAGGNSTGHAIAPFDVVMVTLPGIQQPGEPIFTQWTARWVYREMDRPRTPAAASFTTTLLPLSTELATPYHKNWSATDIPGYPGAGNTPFDNPLIDAIRTLNLTRHLSLVNNENDGHTYALNHQRDIRSAIETAIGIGGADWWMYEWDGVVEAPHFGDRFTHHFTYDQVSSRPQDTPDGTGKIYNQVDVTGGATLDVNGYPIPLIASRSRTGAPYGTDVVGVLPAPPFSDPTLQDQATVDKRGDSLLDRHQIVEQSMELRLVLDASTSGPVRPGDKIELTEEDGSITGPLYIVDWNIVEWTDPTHTVQVVKLNSTFGDYHGNTASPAAYALAYGTLPGLGPTPTAAGGGGACCGGEILMAEASTDDAALISGTTSTTLVTIPITVDTTNSRIRVAAHVWLTEVGAGGKLTLTGPDGTVRMVRYTGAASGEDWDGFSWEVPALAVIAEGSYNVTLAITCNAGPPDPAWTLGYQVLVSLVTSG